MKKNRFVSNILIVMRNLFIPVFLVCFGSFSLFAKDASSQEWLNKRVTFSSQTLKVKTLLAALERQAGIKFIYSSDKVNIQQRISLEPKTYKIADLLNQELNGLGIKFRSVGTNQVVLFAPNVNTVVNQELADITITGIVTNDKGEPMAGVSVTIKGSTVGAVTNEAGRFVIVVPARDSRLVFSYVGYTDQEVVVGNRISIQIQLAATDNPLNEVVVVGYGTQKRINLTGAVGTVSGKVLESRPINNVALGLQGTIANLIITPNNGNPSLNPPITIRGTTSITGGGPLVLVDGVEMNMNLVNPNDVASVTVLKDAAASAIYGVRAAFGVILITTKSASRSGKTAVAYNNNLATSLATKFPEFVKHNWEHAQYINGAMKNANLAPMYTDADIAGMKAWDSSHTNPMYAIVNNEYHFFGYNDWKEMLLKKSYGSQRHNISISGGGEKTRFFASAGYLNQNGPIKVGNDKFNRVNTRLAIENNTFSWLKLGLKMLYNASKYDEANISGFGSWHNFVFTSPVRPFQWLGDPAYPQYDKYAGMYFDDQNSLANLKYAGRKNTRNQDFWGGASADLTFTKDWTAHVDFNYNLNWNRMEYTTRNVPLITFRFAPVGMDPATAGVYRGTNTKDYYSLNAYTQYEKNLNKHYFKGMVGYNQELTQYLEYSGERRGLVNTDVPSLTLGTGIQTVNDLAYEWALQGGFFRLNYAFDNRYLLEFNGRLDGTSRFPKGKNQAFLPSVSAGWLISEEGFMRGTRSWLNLLKVRGSYGELGNQTITANKDNRDYYPYIPFMAGATTKYFIFGTAKDVVVNPPGLVSDQLTWERAKTVNLGFDLYVFSKLNASFDIFTRTTSKMLVGVVLPEVLGTSAPAQNNGQLKTKGWELSLNWNDRINQNLKYGLGVVLSDAQATITSFPNPTGTLTDHYVGKKIGEIWGYTTEGFFKDADDVKNHADQSKMGSNWAAGDVKFADLNGDKVISNGANSLTNHGDLKIIGNTTPRYSFGITPSLSYKGLSMNLFFQGVGKRDYFPNQQAFWPVATQYFATQQWFYDDSWTPENPNAYFPRPVARDGKNQATQTKYLQDASYIRFKSASLGYEFGKEFLNRIKVGSAQIYVTGENLFFISKIKGGYDPETAAYNGAMTYPFPKAFSIGLNLTF